MFLKSNKKGDMQLWPGPRFVRQKRRVIWVFVPSVLPTRPSFFALHGIFLTQELLSSTTFINVTWTLMHNLGLDTFLHLFGLASGSTLTFSLLNLDGLLAAPRRSFVLWRAILGRLPILDVLQRRGFIGPSVCIFCCSASESLDHLLLDCALVREVWSRLASAFQLSLDLSAGFHHLVVQAMNCSLAHRYSLCGVLLL